MSPSGDASRPETSPPEGGPVTTFYLARHGRTALNAAGGLRGHIEVPLHAVGCLEAEALGAVLAQKGPSVIVSSPLVRAQQTALPLAERTHLSIATDARLADRTGQLDWEVILINQVPRDITGPAFQSKSTPKEAP